MPKQPAKLKAAREAIQSNHLFLKSMLGSFDDDGRTPEHLSIANAAASEWAQAHPEVHPGDIEKVRWEQLLWLPAKQESCRDPHVWQWCSEHSDCMADAAAVQRGQAHADVQLGVLRQSGGHNPSLARELLGPSVTLAGF